MFPSHDRRGDFVDGDVPDIEFGVEDIELVSQAAFLAPTLIEKGWVTLSQLDMEDEILRKSILAATTDQKVFSGWQPEEITDKRAEWLARKDQPQPIAELTTNLAGPFFGNLEPVRPQIRKKVEELLQYPFLRKAVLVFGSQLKGYARPNADIDLAVFVRPEAGS